MFLDHVIVEYKESHCFCFLVSEDGTLEPVSTNLRLLSQQLIFHRSLFLYRHSFLVLFEILSFPGLKVEPRVREGTNLRQQSLDKRMEFILKERQRKLRTTSEASHLGGGQKGNEGPRDARDTAGAPVWSLHWWVGLSVLSGQRSAQPLPAAFTPASADCLYGDAEFISWTSPPPHTGLGTMVSLDLMGQKTALSDIYFIRFINIQRKKNP